MNTSSATQLDCPFNRDTLTRIKTSIKARDSKDVRDFLFLKIYTGASVKQLLNLRWSNIDIASGVWDLDVEDGIHTRVLASAAKKIIDSRYKDKDANEKVFPEPGFDRTVYFEWKQALEDVVCPHEDLNNFKIYNEALQKIEIELGKEDVDIQEFAHMLIWSPSSEDFSNKKWSDVRLEEGTYYSHCPPESSWLGMGTYLAHMLKERARRLSKGKGEKEFIFAEPDFIDTFNRRLKQVLEKADVESMDATQFRNELYWVVYLI